IVNCYDKLLINQCNDKLLINQCNDKLLINQCDNLEKIEIIQCNDNPEKLEIENLNFIDTYDIIITMIDKIKKLKEFFVCETNKNEEDEFDYFPSSVNLFEQSNNIMNLN